MALKATVPNFGAVAFFLKRLRQAVGRLDGMCLACETSAMDFDNSGS